MRWVMLTNYSNLKDFWAIGPPLKACPDIFSSGVAKGAVLYWVSNI